MLITIDHDLKTWHAFELEIFLLDTSTRNMGTIIDCGTNRWREYCHDICKGWSLCILFL